MPSPINLIPLYPPVKVFPAKDVVISEEAFAVKRHVTMMTPHTIHVPRLIQNCQKKPGHGKIKNVFHNPTKLAVAGKDIGVFNIYYLLYFICI